MMKLRKIQIKKFCLLTDIKLLLEDKATVIVRRNNSGKTSLTELFRRLLTDSTQNFCLEDFSLSSSDDFWQAFKGKLDGNPEDEFAICFRRLKPI
jgi:predicted ATP-dependent endonuclease of OLD family